MSREWMINLAKEKEIERTKKGDYPSNWPEIADWVKTLAGWQCERCGHAHERYAEEGFVLTVHHLDGNKWNCELWNLAALCQRCHLRIQSRVDFLHIPEVWDWEMNQYRKLTTHSEWMARHIKNYNVWAWLNDKPQMPLERIIKRDYSKEWARK